MVANYPFLTLGCLLEENIVKGKQSKDKTNSSQISSGPTCWVSTREIPSFLIQYLNCGASIQ
jgi:hypothetical protein